jgi:hypothetical protein
MANSSIRKHFNCPIQKSSSFNTEQHGAKQEFLYEAASLLLDGGAA